MHVPTIKTKRLLLRPIDFSDNEAIRKIKNVDPGSAEEWIERVLDLDQPRSYVWAIEVNREMIGTICFWNIHDDVAEIGYDIDPTHHNQGFATEAGQAILSLCQQFGFTHVQAYCQPDNHASIHVALKLGFTFTKSENVFNIYTKKVVDSAFTCEVIYYA